MKFETEIKYAKEMAQNRLSFLTKLSNDVKVSRETKKQLIIEIYATKRVIETIEDLELRFKICIDEDGAI